MIKSRRRKKRKKRKTRRKRRGGAAARRKRNRKKSTRSGGTKGLSGFWQGKLAEKKAAERRRKLEQIRALREEIENSRRRQAQSGEKRPPVSQASTRSWQRGLAAMSAYSRRLSARACANVAPSIDAARPAGSPEAVSGERRVASHTRGRPPDCRER